MKLNELQKMYNKLGFDRFQKEISKKPYAVLGEGSNADSFTKYEEFDLSEAVAYKYANELSANKQIQQDNDWIVIVNYAEAFNNAFEELKPENKNKLNVADALEGIIDYHAVKAIEINNNEPQD